MDAATLVGASPPLAKAPCRGGLASQSLIRVSFDGTSAREAERFDMGNRIREVEQGPGGEIYVLEDGESGRLLKLTPNP